MTELAKRLAIEPMTPTALGRAMDLREEMLRHPQFDFPTEHLFHGGIYTRTIVMPPDTLAAGALIKKAMTLVVSGHCRLFIGERAVELEGHHVIAGSAGRMQAVLAFSKTYISAMMATTATTIAEAESEATDETDLLRSRINKANVLRLGDL
jgi:hypothetical protein